MHETKGYHHHLGLNFSSGNSSCVVLVGVDKVFSDEMRIVLLKEGYRVRIFEQIDDVFYCMDNSVVALLLHSYEGSFELLKSSLRALKEKYGSNVLYMMNHEYSLSAMRHALASGFHEFLAKPLAPEVLLTLLNKKNNELPQV